MHFAVVGHDYDAFIKLQNVWLFNVRCFVCDAKFKNTKNAPDHSMHGGAMLCYGRLRFPMGTYDFWTPPHRNPLIDRHEILQN
jgi:hypothetical protein